MLIGALEIEVRGLGDFFAQCSDDMVAESGIEPDIHDVGYLVVGVHLVPKQLSRLELEPGVDTLIFDPIRSLERQSR